MTTTLLHRTDSPIAIEWRDCFDIRHTSTCPGANETWSSTMDTALEWSYDSGGERMMRSPVLAERSDRRRSLIKITTSCSASCESIFLVQTYGMQSTLRIPAVLARPELLYFPYHRIEFLPARILLHVFPGQATVQPYSQRSQKHCGPGDSAHVLKHAFLCSASLIDKASLSALFLRLFPAAGFRVIDLHNQNTSMLRQRTSTGTKSIAGPEGDCCASWGRLRGSLPFQDANTLDWPFSCARMGAPCLGTPYQRHPLSRLMTPFCFKYFQAEFDAILCLVALVQRF